jgi:hypothetical protein
MALVARNAFMIASAVERRQTKIFKTFHTVLPGPESFRSGALNKT